MKKLNELQSYLTRLRGLMLTLIILCSIGVGNAWGAEETVTYTITSTTAVSTDGTAPAGSSASYSQTYSTAGQATKGNTMTLTLTGFDGCTITGLSCEVGCYTGWFGYVSGKGTISISINGDKKGSSSLDHPAAHSVETVSVLRTTVAEDGTIVITISATESSLYCYSYKITYTPPCTPLGTINGPVSLSTDGCGAGELKATWKMLATTGIASQILKVYDENSNEVTAKRVTGLTASTSTQTVTISGLNPCKEYHVTVENVSSGGEYCAAGEPWVSTVETTPGYTYTINKTNVSLKAGETEAANSCDDFYAIYVADAGYTLPTSISVTNAGAENTGWTWNSSTGVLKIYKTYVTGNVTVKITGAQSNYTVRWSVNGADWTHGNPSTSVTYNTKPSTIPTAPDGDEVCGGKVFVGWTNAAINSPTDERPAILFTSQSGAPVITENTTFYAVFATASGGGGTKWVLTSLDAVTAGTYAIVNQSNKAFNGKITDGHGNVTEGTFTFIDGEASSAPSETCEVTFEVQGDGFSMYNTSSSKYLYASKAASGGLAQQDSKPTDYWNYYNPNWQYHYNYNGSYARLRSAEYTPGGLRVYGNNSGDGVIKLAKKISSSSYSAYSTSCVGCANSITISKGSESNGTFTLSATGAQPSCAGEVDIIVTPSPADGYRVKNVTATAGSPTITDNGNGTWTVSFAQNTNVSSTINVSFEAIPRYTITLSTGTGSVSGGGWSGSAGTYTKQQASEGASITLPTASPSSACTALGWTFAGWKEGGTQDETTSAPTLVAAETPVTPESDVTYYAVYKMTEGGGGGGSASVTFNTAGSDSNTSRDTDSDIKKYIVDTYSGISSFAADRLYVGKNGAKLGTSSSSGSITLNLSSNITTNTITIVASQYGSDAGKLTVTVNGSTKFGSEIAPSTGTCTFTHASNVEISSITIATTKERAYISSISLSSSGTTTWTSSPACEGTATVTYDANGATSGTAPTDGNSYSLGASVTVLGNTGNLTKTGLNFGGWNTAADGSGTTYQPGATFTIKSNTTLYAKWVTLRTVTLIDNGHSTNVYVADGETYSLPDEGESNCEDATFLGWATGKYTGHATGTDVTPSYDAPGTSKVITADVTFVAVYASGELTNNYREITNIDDLTNGEYIIEYGNYALTKTESSKYCNVMESKSVSPSSSIITTTDADIIWTFNKISDGRYTIKNGNQYLCTYDCPLVKGGTETSLGILPDAYTWSISYSSSMWWIASQTSGYYVDRAVTGSDGWRLYHGSPYSIAIYKRQMDAFYTSKPQCCYEPAEALTLTAGGSSIVNSGTVVLTLTGGNGKAVTWTCKDEADNNCDSYLSETSGSGAKVNLPANAATKVYTITATQADDKTDADNVICGASVSTSITVKTQFTITLNIKDNSETNLYDTYTVTDGESYTLPDISDDYNCEENYSFAGWSTNESATSVEKTAGSTVTATAATTWWAVWSLDAGGKETVTKYEKVTGNGELVADATFVLAYAANAMNTSVSSGCAGKVSVTWADDESYVAFPSTTTTVQILTLKGSTGAWKLYDATNSKWLVMSTYNGNISWTDTEANATAFAITTDGKAAIKAGDYYLQYNASSPRFKGYESSSKQKNATLYKNKGNTVSIASDVSATYFVNNEHCFSGSIIRAESGKWVTSANGKKVKISIPVIAKGFSDAAELSASSNNSNFAVSLVSTAIPVTPAQLETSLIVEYTPAEAETTESATITLSAGDAMKHIVVNGRSLPDEFAIISKKNGLWYALPADMNAGQSQYAGVQVTPDDPTTPNILPVSPSTIIYSLQEVTPTRYEAAGNCVRLTGNGNKCLWSNAATTNTTIQNYAVLGNTNGSNYEWQLSTTDGVNYTITNPAHPDYASGRMLAMGGTGGTQFGMYKTAATFCIVPVGCSSLPTEVSVSPKRTQATFSWTSNAGSTRIDVWTNEAMSEGNINITASSSPAVLTGLTENTPYWYKLTPEGSSDCAYTGTFSTTGPTIDIVEWLENGVNVMIDAAGDPRIVISGEVEHGVGSASATTLFFAKYFEGSGSMKLLSIFNGTANNISLADYTIKELHAGEGAGAYGSIKEYDLSSLGSIAAGQEIIFYTRPSQSWLTSCSNAYFGAVSSKNTASDNPRWIECDGSTFAKLEFNGNDALILYNRNDEVDIIGGMSTPGSDDNCRYEDSWTGTALNMDYQKKPGDAEFAGFFDNSSLKDVISSNYSTADSIAFLEKCGINLSDEVINATTARIILFRNKTVTEGVTTNTGADFASLTKEQWSGRSVCQTSDMYTAAGYTSDGEATCSSYQFLGDFDYNEYYTDFTELDNTYLSDLGLNADGSRTILIDNMRQYACLNLEFQVTDHDDASNILTRQTAQVPIVVVDSRNSNDPLFNNVVKDDKGAPLVDASIKRCKTCNVVIRGGGTLTKATDDSPNDVAELFNLKVYPNGKLIIPEGANYNYKLNTLAMRRDGEDIPLADIQGGLTIGQSKGVYLDLRIDHSDWHYVALPYDCRLSDVTFSDGTVAVLNTDYFIAAYDGEYRAANKKTKWTDIMDDDYVLKKGIGHIIALSGSGSDKRELRFPMANDVISEEKASSKTVSGVYGYGADKTDEELRPNHKGWNMVGNPYFKYFSPAEFTTPLATGELVHSPGVPWDGTWIIKEGTKHLRYVVRPIDNGWSGYKQVLIGGTKMEPFTAYFVQIGITGEQTPETEQSVIFDKSKLSMSAPAHRRVKAEETENMYPVWYGIEMIAPNAEKDQTALLISDEFTDGYDMMNDLAKQRGDYYTYYNKPVLASRNNEGEMAFNALPDSSAATVGVPLNYYAAQAGTYTIATDNRFNLEEVKSAMLHDATNNTYTDLLTQNYEFTASKGNNTNRFTLYVRVERKKAPEVATGTDNILENGKLSLIAIDRTLVLSGLDEAADIYVYDMSGKLIKGERNAGESVWRANVSAQGVYFVRVNSQSGQQTLRTIVK